MSHSKPTLLVSQDKTIFQLYFFEEIWEKYFNVEILDVNKNYDKRSTVVVSDWLDFEHKRNVNECIIADKGIRHIIDHCPDSWCSKLDGSADFMLRPRDYYQFRESIQFKVLGYNKLVLTSNPTRDFLLLMNIAKPWRTKLYNTLLPLLKDNIYSYVQYGIPLQNAQDQVYNETTWQRYINPDWYTDTRFSIVSESGHMECLYNSQDDINVTEKILKACAFKHPYIIWGQPGTLAWQKRQGFETFDHCIDESYDNIQDEDIRFDCVMAQINRCMQDKTIFTDELTQQKLEHNYNHFYDEEIVMNVMHEQIINPLLEFING